MDTKNTSSSNSYDIESIIQEVSEKDSSVLCQEVTSIGDTMEELKTLYKEPKGTTREIKGSFKPFFPTQELETIQVYKFKFLVENNLQFVIERDGYDRVAYLAKSEFNSLLCGLKLQGSDNEQ